MWFVVGVLIFLYDVLDWSFMEVGGFLAIWEIGYGVVQVGTPNLLRRFGDTLLAETHIFQRIAYLLAAVPVTIVMAIRSGFTPSVMIIGGLAVFGILFALNSSLHSYLNLAFTESDKVALNIGFYYMANAGGRLLGTLLSGLSYQMFDLTGCLLTASVMVVTAVF